MRDEANRGLRAAFAAGALGAGPLLIAYAALEDARAYHRDEPRGAAYFGPLVVVAIGGLVASVGWSWSTPPRGAAWLTRLATAIFVGALIGCAVCAAAIASYPSKSGEGLVIDELAGFVIGGAGAVLTAIGAAIAPRRAPPQIAEDIEPPEPGFFEELERRRAEALARAGDEPPAIDDEPPRYELIGGRPSPSDAELAEATRRLARAHRVPTLLAIGVGAAAIAHAAILWRGAQTPPDLDEPLDARNFIAAVLLRVDVETEAELRAEAEARGEDTDSPRWSPPNPPCPRRGEPIGHCSWGLWRTDFAPLDLVAIYYDAGAWSCSPRDEGPSPECRYALSMDRFAGIGGPHDAKLAAEIGARGEPASIDTHAPAMSMQVHQLPPRSEDMARRLRSIAPALRLCGARFGSSRPTHLDARFVVDREGQIRSAGNAGSDGSPAIPRCAISALLAIDFTDAQWAHIAVVNATFDFEARPPPADPH